MKGQTTMSNYYSKPMPRVEGKNGEFALVFADGRKAWYKRIEVECSCGHHKFMDVARGAKNEANERRVAKAFDVCPDCIAAREAGLPDGWGI
jgi:hypothetical protein